MLYILIFGSALFLYYLYNLSVSLIFFFTFYYFLCNTSKIKLANSSCNSTREPSTNKLFLFVGIFTLIFILISGNYIWSFLNIDWELRATLLHDLVIYNWPVTYHDNYILRTSLGFYLPPAFVGKFLGYEFSVFFIYLIYFLFFFSILKLFKSSIKNFLSFIFFSSPDIYGLLITKFVIVFFVFLNIVPDNFLNYFSNFSIGTHIEWWAYSNQISSNFTLLSWVPNHSMMTIFFALLLIINRNLPHRFILFSILSMLSIIWSPFSFVALLSVIFMLARKKHMLHFISHLKNYIVLILLSGMVVFACLNFYFFDFDEIPKRVNLIGPYKIPMNFLLVFVEIFLPTMIFIRHQILRKFMIRLGFFILFFSFFNVGLSNDFFMRSIVGLTTIYFFFLSKEFVFYIKKNRLNLLKLLLILPFLFTSFQEVSRFFIGRQIPIDLSKNVFDLTNGQFNHYYYKR